MKHTKEFTLGKYLGLTEEGYKVVRNSSIAKNINISKSTANPFARAVFSAFIDYINGNDQSIKKIIDDINSIKSKLEKEPVDKKIEKKLQELVVLCYNKHLLKNKNNTN